MQTEHLADGVNGSRDKFYVAYNHDPLFGYADATTLQFAGLWQNSDGWTIYERGEAEPSF